MIEFISIESDKSTRHVHIEHTTYTDKPRSIPYQSGHISATFPFLRQFFHTFYFPRTQLSRPQSGRDKKDEMRLLPRPGHPVRLLVVEKCCDNVPSLVLSIRPSQWSKPSLSRLGPSPQRAKPHIFFRFRMYVVVRGCMRGV